MRTIGLREASLVGVALLLAGLAPTAAEAQTDIYYSKPENTYGWCTNQGSYEATRQCARGYCLDSGGSACELVLECPDGWSAIATSDRGFGAACKRSSTFYARQWALTYCIVASGDLCWTEYTFRADRQASDAEDKAFDDAWYAQLLLQRVGYELGIVDGAMGPKTRKALREYQASRGLPVSGEITQETLDRLFAEKDGIAGLVAIVRRELYEAETNPSPQITYGYGEPAESTSETLARAMDAYDAGDFATAALLWAGLAERGDAVAQYNLALSYADGEGVPQDYAKAAEWYRKAAEQGHASAQLNLGNLYYSGKGVTKDLAAALGWYTKAAEQGHAVAQNNLGMMYEDGEGVAQDYEGAAEWYRKAAEQGDAAAQANLGYLYENGRGVPKDYEQAVAWYRKSAEQGNAQGQADLGYMYEMGYGVPKDIDQAIEWYRKAADQGNEDAEEALWWLEEEAAWQEDETSSGTTTGETAGSVEAAQNAYEAGDYARALQILRPLAEAGNADAQVGLAFAYYDGNGVTQDYAQALAWFGKAADQGHAIAQNNIGYMHRNGQGVPASDAEAAAWFRKSAEAGYDLGQVNYADLLEQGLGVPRDVAAALDWYRKAAAQGNQIAKDAVARLEAASGAAVTGNPLEAFNAGDYALAAKLWRSLADLGDAEAQFSLGYLYEQGLGVAKDVDQAVLLYRRAAEQGHKIAQNNLGVLYESGGAVPQDHAEAAHWYRMAAERGYALAQRNLAQMYEAGRGVPADRDQALLWYRRAAGQGDATAKEALQRLGG
jgi:hypothetical protein